MKQDLKIKGMKDYRIEGEYNRVVKKGMGNLIGDVYCESMKIKGVGNVKGDIIAKGEVIKTSVGNTKGKIECKTLIVQGAGNVEGKVFATDAVIKKGEGDILAEIRTDTVIKVGPGDIQGKIYCNNLMKQGPGDIQGDMVVENEVYVEGAGDIHGDIQCEVFINKGMGSIKTIQANKIESYGSLHARRPIEAEEVIIDGEIKVDGLLNAGKIEIAHAGVCNISEIGGEDIRIYKNQNGIKTSNKLLNLIANSKTNKSKWKFKSDIIEGDNIYLEDVIVKKVIGHNITIGPRCKIKYLECSGELVRDDTSDITQVIQED